MGFVAGIAYKPSTLKSKHTYTTMLVQVSYDEVHMLNIWILDLISSSVVFIFKWLTQYVKNLTPELPAWVMWLDYSESDSRCPGHSVSVIASHWWHISSIMTHFLIFPNRMISGKCICIHKGVYLHGRCGMGFPLCMCVGPATNYCFHYWFSWLVD